MPAANRGLLDSVKTSSYHIKSVILCKQTKKGPPNSVQLVVWRDGGNKTYEFEAEDSKKAGAFTSPIQTSSMLIILPCIGSGDRVVREKLAKLVQG